MGGQPGLGTPALRRKRKTSGLEFGYLFTHLPDTAMARKLKVHHGVELAYVFGNMDKSEGYTDKDLWLSSNNDEFLGEFF
ncbi:MAG: hypothetical protein WA974_05020 [Thermodesulfobacteriota bacterium]